MKRLAIYGAVLGTVAVLLGCKDFVVPNYNDLSVQDLTSKPTRTGIATAAQGLLSGQRGLTRAYVIETGTWGREVYNLRPEEPRTITEVLISPLNGRNPFWSGPYTQLRNAFLVLHAVDAAEGSELTDAEKEGIRGFTKTLMADAYFDIIQGVGDFGAPLDIDRDPTGELAPIVGEDSVYAYVFHLYDEAKTHLQNAGASFAFQLTAGLANFNTPAKFLKLNRALKVRALKYRSRWADVLATLPETFVDESASLALGAYHSYSTTSGDETNDLCCSPSYYAHPRIRADAQLKGDGTLDQRALDKTRVVPAFTLSGITVTEKFNHFKTLADPLPWIRNEELLLIRAEANLAGGDPAAALQDVNLIRTASGKLDPVSSATWNAMSGDAKLTEILYNKFMSLVLEGGFSYLDARQYGRLGLLPKAKDISGNDLGHVVFPRYPFPTNECLARDLETAAACQIIYGS